MTRITETTPWLQHVSNAQNCWDGGRSNVLVAEKEAAHGGEGGTEGDIAGVEETAET